MMLIKQLRLGGVIGACIAILSGCVVSPSRLDNLEQDRNRLFERRVELSLALSATATDLNRQFVESLSEDQGFVHGENAKQNLLIAPILGPGDVLHVRISGLDSLDGFYQVTSDGKMELPYLESIAVAGLTRAQLLKKLTIVLVEQNWFYPEQVNLDVSIVKLAPIMVAVHGAVFNSGQVAINSKPPLKPDEQIQHRSGAFSPDRNVLAALRAAGGVRPDADLNQVFVKRGSSVTKISLQHTISGTKTSAIPTLVAGDEIFVASTQKENAQLVRPSQITPPGMRILMSNLTAPALNNAQSSVGADSTRLPYGSSLLDSAISANCVGGTQSANASRMLVLVTRNYGSEQQIVIKRTINRLLANSSNHQVNPLLMPNDAVACYDSRFTNFRDVARGLGELITPLIFGGLL